ncbi:hypothetical protein J3458_009273 [Metarhizium acridum]|uniref:uncharacterized protein n=1 Tax=Metarhizium acridum TaxID=92637 RepID=UPI001C6C438F|nr:hypothetical protein J3458_009273 [Metarhizium acridum]
MLGKVHHPSSSQAASAKHDRQYTNPHMKTRVTARTLLLLILQAARAPAALEADITKALRMVISEIVALGALLAVVNPGAPVFHVVASLLGKRKRDKGSEANENSVEMHLGLSFFFFSKKQVCNLKDGLKRCR